MYADRRKTWTKFLSFFWLKLNPAFFEGDLTFHFFLLTNICLKFKFNSTPDSRYETMFHQYSCGSRPRLPALNLALETLQWTLGIHIENFNSNNNFWSYFIITEQSKNIWIFVLVLMSSYWNSFKLHLVWPFFRIEMFQVQVLKM